MTAIRAYNMGELRKFHRFLAIWMQAENEGNEIPPTIFRQMGFAKQDLDSLFEEEDRKGMSELRKIVKIVSANFLKEKTPSVSSHTLNEKPLEVYSFGKGSQRINIPQICIGIKPDESRESKYAEWFFWGRGLEHARGTIIAKHPDAPLTPRGIPMPVFYLMSEEEKRGYKKKYYPQWQDYSKRWGAKNKEEAEKVVRGIEAKFDVINAYPLHLRYGNAPLTATSHMHAFIPHTDLEGKIAGIRQNSYRFKNIEDAVNFVKDVMDIGGRQLELNNNFLHFLTEGVLPYHDAILLEEPNNEMCLVVRDKDVVIEVIAPAGLPEYESQMYFIPRIALTKKNDHIVKWPTKEEAIRYYNRRITTSPGEKREVKWLPKDAHGFNIIIGKSRHVVIRVGNSILESRYGNEEKEKRRVIEKFGLYNKGPSTLSLRGEPQQHYLDTIRPLPVNLSMGWFVHNDTRLEVFDSRHGMIMDGSANGIRSHDYFTYPKKLAQYGRGYKWAGAIVMNILREGVNYEFQVMTPESLIENEVGKYSRVNYRKFRADVRRNVLKDYFRKFDSLMKEMNSQ